MDTTYHVLYLNSLTLVIFLLIGTNVKLIAELHSLVGNICSSDNPTRIKNPTLLQIMIILTITVSLISGMIGIVVSLIQHAVFVQAFVVYVTGIVLATSIVAKLYRANQYD